MLARLLPPSRSRRAFLSTLSVLALTAITPKAFAGEEWCTDDPPITLLLQGRPVTVNTFFSAPVSQREALQYAWVTGEAWGSTITITATLPGTVFRVYSEIPALDRSAGNPLEVHSAGQVVTLCFTGLTPALLDQLGERSAPAVAAQPTGWAFAAGVLS